MDDNTRGTRDDLENLVQTSNRSIRFQVRHKVGSLLITSSRSRSVGGRRTINEMGQIDRMCVSPLAILEKAVKTMVPRTEGPLTLESPKLHLGRRSLIQPRSGIKHRIQRY